jgi:hypothetical protein
LKSFRQDSRLQGGLSFGMNAIVEKTSLNDGVFLQKDHTADVRFAFG